METVVVLLAFALSGIIGFPVVRKVDAFLEECRNQQENGLTDEESDETENGTGQ